MAGFYNLLNDSFSGMYVFAILIYSILISLIIRYDVKKYKINTPYVLPKKKNPFLKRLSLGIMAGIHYSHFIGTYNHKKYNTQAFTPKTLECYIGVASSVLITIVYIGLAWYLGRLFGAVGLLILAIPIILNLISIYLDKKK